MSIIIKPSTFETSKIHYSQPEINSIAGQKVTYKRIRLNYEMNDDLKPLIIESPANLLSWGLDEDRDMNTNALHGYKMAINLWSKPNKTAEEEKFIETIDQICDNAKKHLVDNREKIERYDLEVSDLKKFNPLYWKTEKGQRVPDKGPTLYAKCKYNKRDQSIATVFMDENESIRIDPMTILKEHCYVKFLLLVESIYIGTTISLQLKLHEVLFRLKDSPKNLRKSLLCPNISMDIKKISPENTIDVIPFEKDTMDTTESFEEEYVYEEVEEEEDNESIIVKEEVITPKIEEKIIVDTPVVPKKKTTKTKKITA